MRPVSTLSGGQRRRLDVAIGLVHTPRLLFLDEPSTGLDPQNRVNLQEQIRRLHDEQGTTIVLTTHYLEEADAIADRVVVIDHGLVIADDTASRLKSALGDLVTLGFADEAAAVLAAEGAAWALGDNAVGRADRHDGPGPGRTGGDRAARPGHRPRPGRARPSAGSRSSADPRRRVPRPDRPQPAREQRAQHRRARRDRRRGSMTATHRDRPVIIRDPRGEPAQGARRPRRHLERDGPRAAAGVPRAGVGAVRDGAAAGVPRRCSRRCCPKVEDGSALQWFVPGIIAMTALMGASFTGANLTQEIVTGSHERLLVSPLSQVLAAGRPGAQGDRADADAGRDHRGRRDAVQLRPAPRARAGGRGRCWRCSASASAR